MSTKSKIEWCDVTWNPVRGCSMVSAGCANCYAMKQAHRFSGKGQHYEGLTELGPQGPRWNGKITLVDRALEVPLRLKEPRRIFVNSMSDLFHEDVPNEFIDKVFAVMLCAPRHTFQILTKRPQRMLDYMMTDDGFGRSGHIWHAAYNVEGIHVPKGKMPPPFPYPHVWLGVSVENQATADERIPILLQTPAAVRFVSYEPALGPVDFWGARYPLPDGGLGSAFAWGKGINWMIIGGESGPHARPFDLAWARSAIAECKAAECAVFVKQFGANIAPVIIEGGSVKERLFLKDKKGGDMAEFPPDLRVREFPR